MIKKILVIRYRFIGDTVLTIPFLRNLRKAYPEAQIDMLVGPISGDVLLNCPYIDNLIYFDTTRKHKYENPASKNDLQKPQAKQSSASAFFTPARQTFFSYVKLLKQNNYDKAYVLKGLFPALYLLFWRE